MTTFSLRPRFSAQLDKKPEEIINRIQKLSKTPNRQIETTIENNHINFNFFPEFQHYWSPQLNLEISEEDKKTHLRGLFGPSPKVWSMFLFIYSGIGFLGLVGLLYGLAQWNLNINPTGMWVVLGAIILELTFYLIARAGRKLAANQMMILKKELVDILDDEN